jgi:hypothetical protein
MVTPRSVLPACVTASLCLALAVFLSLAGPLPAQPFRRGGLEGDWLNQGDPNQRCGIEVRGTAQAPGGQGGTLFDLRLINEKGGESRGVYLSVPGQGARPGRFSLRATDWDNLRGVVLPGEEVIVWWGAGYWTRRPRAEAVWDNQGRCRMVFDRGRIWAVNEKGDGTGIDLRENGTVYARDWGNLEGRFMPSGEIRWENGTHWFR